MLTRRHFLQGFGGLTLGTAALGSYAFAIEPGLMLGVTRYNVTPATWPADLRLKIAVIADIHACEPWMSAERIGSIVAQTNALGADVIVLLGDYVGGHKFATGRVDPARWPLAAGCSTGSGWCLRSACSPSGSPTRCTSSTRPVATTRRATGPAPA